jgi:hypothetical protein
MSLVGLFNTLFTPGVTAPTPPLPLDPILPEQEPRKPSSTHERKARGQRARIQREEIEHALDRMALRAAKAWSESSPDETAKREEAYRLVNVIHALRKELRSVEADGEMAAREETLRPADNR